MHRRSAPTTIVARNREDAAKLSTSEATAAQRVDNRVMTPPGARDEIGRFLTVADAAELLAVDVATVDELIRSGELPAIRVGNAGPWRVERTQLEVWIEEQYEQTRRYSSWNQGEFANVAELSGVKRGRIRPVD
jgi:excisionase family DNA binding protein